MVQTLREPMPCLVDSEAYSSTTSQPVTWAKESIWNSTREKKAQEISPRKRCEAHRRLYVRPNNCLCSPSMNTHVICRRSTNLLQPVKALQPFGRWREAEGSLSHRAPQASSATDASTFQQADGHGTTVFWGILTHCIPANPPLEATLRWKAMAVQHQACQGCDTVSGVEVYQHALFYVKEGLICHYINRWPIGLSPTHGESYVQAVAALLTGTPQALS